MLLNQIRDRVEPRTSVHRRTRGAFLIRLVFTFVLLSGGFSGLAPISGPSAVETAEAHHTSIKLPVPAGQRWIASQGYNTNPAAGGSHYNCDPSTLRDEPSGTRSCSQYWQYKYSFDLVPADGSSAAGYTVLSPVNGVIRWIDEAYGGMSINLEDGFAYAYFHTVLAPGLAAGQRVTQGQYLGTVAPPGQGGNGGFPHLHVTLWQTSDGGNWSRTPVAFEGAQAIEGVSLAALSDSSVNQHRGVSFTSTNVALAADAVPPSPPVHVAPSHGVTYDATSHVATLSWSPSTGASEYQVWINDAPASGWITATSWTTPTLGTGQYAWQVKARGGGGEGSLSGKWVFWVDPSGNDDLPPLSTTPGTLGVSTSPTSGSPGIQVVVTGAGMSANENVRVFWDSTSGTLIGETTANSAGNWRITFTLPDATGGQHQIIARGVSSNRNAASTLTVNSALLRAPISGVPGTPIAVTVKGFGANETVNLTFFHSSMSQHVLGSARTDANGTGTTTVEMPASTAGQHDYRGLGQTSGRIAWGALWVVSQITLSTDQGSPGDTVAATVRGMPGSSSARVAWNQSGTSPGTTLCSGTTSSTGTIVCTFTVPTAAAGAYPIVATVGSTSVSATFSIAGSSAMTITPAGGVVGAQFQISLGGYQPNELVRLTFDNATTAWREVRVGSNGTTLLKTTIPFLANGSHSLTARGVTSGRTSSGSITISPSMELNQAGGAPGSTASAWMRGFTADTSITLRFNSTNASNGTSVCSGRTNSTGTFNCNFVVPSIPAATYPVRAVSNGLNATANFAVTSAGEIVGGAVIGIGTYQVTATREGLVGGTTSSGHVIVPNDHFVSLPACTPSNCSWLTPGSTHATYGYITDCGARCFVRVTNPATGICRVEPIYDLGPWFTNDNWWEPAERRNLNNLSTSVNVLPQGYPGTDAARDGLDVGYGLSNGIGKSNVGYETGNRAAIDIADGTWQDIGFAYAAGIGTVVVSMLWQTGEDVNAARQACFETSEEPTPTGDPRVNISSLSGHSGDLVTVTGTGYGVNEFVNIFWDRTSSGSPIAQTRASASGAFSVVVTIPDDLPGTHLLVGKGASTSGQASRSYLVLPPTRITLEPLSGATGSATSVTGNGFHRGETVQVFWDATGSTGTLLTSTVANDAGEINVSVTIPSSTSGGHYIVGLGSSSGLKASRTFTITEGTTGPSAPRVALSATSSFVGANITVTGTGYASGESVEIFWDSTGSTGVLLTTVNASGSGEFSTIITIPQTTDGKHLIVGRSTQSGMKPSRSLIIQAPPAIEANVSTGEPGSAAVVDGVRFAPQESVELFWNSTSTAPLASVGANPDGSFSIGISIPATAPAGPHAVIARGATSGFEATLEFTVSAPPSTAISFEPMSGPPGTSVSVTGTGFGNGELVRIRWDNTSSGPMLGSVNANSAGAFTISVTVPDASEGPHRLIAHAQTSNKKPFLDFTVTEPQVVDPRISIDPVQGRTGSTVVVSGTNYQPGERVELRWNASSTSAPLLATATANSSGAFNAQVTIPNVVGGPYRIVGKGLSSGKNPTRTFTVTPSTGGSAVNVEPGDELRLTVRGFQAGETIEIYFDSITGTPLATVTTNSIGVAATSIIIPDVVNGAHAVLAVGGATSAPAYPVTVSNGSDQPASASFPESSGAPGARVTLDLANFWSAERVEVFWDGRTSPTSSFIIETTGSYSGQITIPTLPGGAHVVTIRGVTSGKSATANITLTPSTVLTPPIGAVGARIVVDVKGSTTGTLVSVFFNRPEGGSGGTLVCSATARDSGTASCSFLVPAGYPVGTVVPITATGSAGNSMALFEVRNEPVGFGPAEDVVEEPGEPADASSVPSPDDAANAHEAPVSDSESPADQDTSTVDGSTADQDEATPEPTATPEPAPDPPPEPTIEPKPEPRTVVINASADVTVFSARPDDAATEQIGVVQAGGNDGATTFITFNVEGVGSGTIVDVRLVLSGSGEIGGYDPVSIVPGLWVDEVSATYTDLPTSGLTPATDSNWSPVFVPPVAGGDHARVDITTSITGDGVVTVVITGNPDTVAGFLSRESGNPPRLEITVQD
jgi:hypothetical protein